MPTGFEFRYSARGQKVDGEKLQKSVSIWAKTFVRL